MQDIEAVSSDHLHSNSLCESARVTAEIINPLIKSTVETFEQMLRCQAQRIGVLAGHQPASGSPVMASIALTGRIQGLIYLSIPPETAIAAVERILDQQETEVNELVLDCVRELANIIAGATKEKLSQKLKLGLPSIYSGEPSMIVFPPQSHPLTTTFHSEIGPFQLTCGFVAVAA